MPKHKMKQHRKWLWLISVIIVIIIIASVYAITAGLFDTPPDEDFCIEDYHCSMLCDRNDAFTRCLSSNYISWLLQSRNLEVLEGEYLCSLHPDRGLCKCIENQCTHFPMRCFSIDGHITSLNELQRTEYGVECMHVIFKEECENKDFFNQETQIFKPDGIPDCEWRLRE